MISNAIDEIQRWTEIMISRPFVGISVPEFDLFEQLPELGTLTGTVHANLRQFRYLWRKQTIFCST